MESIDKKSLFLEEVDSLFHDLPLNYREISNKLKFRGPMVLILICVTPFMQPIPIPGVSSILGLVIALQGLSLLTPNKNILLIPWIAKKIMTKEDFIFFKKGAHKIYPLFSKFIKARGSNIMKSSILMIMSGLLIILLALFLSLPLPIPSSNFLPAIGIFTIALAHLEEDLILLISGYVYSAVMLGLVSYSVVFISEIGWRNLF